MTLLAPVALWFLLALPLIFILYLIQSRYRPQVVASLLLWRRMARDLEAEASWRRPRWDLLLALQLIVALLVGLALARPAMLSGGGQRLVVVLDTSASMAARDVAPSRFAAARQEVINVVNAAPVDARVSLVTAGLQPRVVVDNGSPATVLAALDGLQTEATAGDLSGALRVAAGLAAPEAANGSHVVAVTDGALDLDLPGQAVPVSFKLVGGSGQNLAISEVTLRRPIDRADYLAGFARVVNFNADARSTSMTIMADNRPVDRAPVTVAAAGHADATFRVPAGSQTISVVLAERDTMPGDDRVDLLGYARWSRRAMIVSDAPAAWEHVFSVVPDLTTRSVRPQDFSPTEVTPGDILLFDGVVPKDLPKTGFILVNPPDNSTVLSRTDTLPRQRRASHFDADDPLLKGLDIAPLNVQQLERAVTPAWAASSVDAEDTPLILHGRLGNQRAVIFTFDPNKSNLPHLAAFPLLMANAVDWLTPGRDAILHGGMDSKTSIQPRPMADVAASGATGAVPSLNELWPWLVAAAALLFAAEWAVALRRG
ncbi:MAG TPA: BatA and WFA domain-containing protein [Chloroflexota bacterium]